MNISLLMGSYLPDTGGEQTYLKALGSELHRIGHKVTICTLSKKGLHNFEINEGINVFRFESLLQKVPSREGKPHPPCTDSLVTQSLKTIFNKTKPDVINAHDWMLFSIVSPRKRFGIPLVVTLHNYSLICTNGLLERNRKTCDHPLTSQCIGCGSDLYNFSVMKYFVVYCCLKIGQSRLKQVDKFIATHSFQKSMYSKWLGLREKDIVVVPNPIDLTEFHPINLAEKAIASYTKKWGLETGSNKIVYVGRLWWDKMETITNVINATPAITAEFPNTQILIVGDGECFSYLSKLSERVNRMLNRTAVIVTGRVENSEIAQIMSLADFTIGVGRVVLEAMACGKPAIVAGSMAGPFGGNYGSIITPDNVADLSAYNFNGRNSSVRTTPTKIAEDCVKLLANRKHRSYLGSFGRKYVEREHDVTKIARRVETVYFDAINGAR